MRKFIIQIMGINLNTMLKWSKHDDTCLHLTTIHDWMWLTSYGYGYVECKGSSVNFSLNSSVEESVDTTVEEKNVGIFSAHQAYTYSNGISMIQEIYEIVYAFGLHQNNCVPKLPKWMARQTITSTLPCLAFTSIKSLNGNSNSRMQLQIELYR